MTQQKLMKLYNEMKEWIKIYNHHLKRDLKIGIYMMYRGEEDIIAPSLAIYAYVEEQHKGFEDKIPLCADINMRVLKDCVLDIHNQWIHGKRYKTKKWTSDLEEEWLKGETNEH